MVTINRPFNTPIYRIDVEYGIYFTSETETRRDVIIACYFHTENSTFHNVKITACEIYHFYSMDNIRYFTAENAIKYGNH